MRQKKYTSQPQPRGQSRMETDTCMDSNMWGQPPRLSRRAKRGVLAWQPLT
jgi:hypothetical protein